MKLIKIVKLARVKYGDLDEKDLLTTERLLSEGRRIPKEFTAHKEWSEHSPVVLALDTTKYPPEEVTYTIEGIPEDSIGKYPGNEDRVFMDDVYTFDESEIETRYV